MSNKDFLELPYVYGIPERVDILFFRVSGIQAIKPTQKGNRSIVYIATGQHFLIDMPPEKVMSEILEGSWYR